MNKIVAGVCTYTHATHILAGALVMTPANFTAEDIGHTIACTDGEAVYFARIKRVISASSVEVYPSARMIQGNWAFAAGAVFVLDQGETHAHADYLARVRVHTQDDVNKLTDDEYIALLAAAVTDYGEDKKLVVAFKVAGNGTKVYNAATVFGAYWQRGTVYIESVEYPIGNVPPVHLDMNHVRLYDDGTAQDGSNVVIMLENVAPAATEFFVVNARIMPRLPQAGTPTLPDTDSNFNNVTLLAAAYACYALASAYALSTDSTIAGDVVNYGDKVDKYLRLARTYLQRYNVSVFGAEEPTSTAAAATVTLSLERRASDRGNFLFH